MSIDKYPYLKQVQIALFVVDVDQRQTRNRDRVHFRAFSEHVVAQVSQSNIHSPLGLQMNAVLERRESNHEDYTPTLCTWYVIDGK